MENLLHSIQKNVSWRAIPVAGGAAGTVYLISNFILMPLALEIDAALMLRYIASLVLGEDVLTKSEPLVYVVGLGLHYLLSMVFALVIAIVIHRWGLTIGIVGGGFLGLAIYSINLYTFTVFFEWFFAINSSPLLVSHILFGATAGGVYELFDHYDRPFGLEENHAAE